MYHPTAPPVAHMIKPQPVRPPPTASSSSPPELTVLVLCGLPGSGKSTIASALTSHATQRWVRASQDDAPNRKRQECEAMVRDGLRSGCNVLVDRVGFDRSQRAHFIRIAQEAEFSSNVQVHCLILDVPIPALQDRLYLRQSHPTLPDFDTALRVLGQMQREYKPPVRNQPEGFRRVWTLPADDQPDWGIWNDQLLDAVLGRIEREGYEDPAGSRPPVVPQREARYDQRGPRGYQGQRQTEGQWRQAPGIPPSGHANHPAPPGTF